MRLNPEEQTMLSGDLGSGVQKAMEILTALGTIYGAEDLVPVTSVQVAPEPCQGLMVLRDGGSWRGTSRLPGSTRRTS